MDHLIQPECIHTAMEDVWRATYLDCLRPAITDELVANPQIFFSTHCDAFLRSRWNLVRTVTMADPWRLGVLLDLAVGASPLAGDFVECGSYRGGTGVLLGLLLRELGVNKKVFLLDSFEGLPAPDHLRDRGYLGGQLKGDLAALVSLIDELGLGATVLVKKGWFRQSIPDLIADQEITCISLLHVDCDLYQSTRDCLPALYPLVSHGAPIVFDDFNDGARGEKRAVLEFFGERSERQCFHVGPVPQIHVIKGAPFVASIDKVDAGTHQYDFRYYRTNPCYREWIRQKVSGDVMEQVMIAVREDKKETHG
ncbi:MAG: TylF/MycF/NovP-related O-methyltransferase [bacterium]